MNRGPKEVPSDEIEVSFFFFRKEEQIPRRILEV